MFFAEGIIWLLILYDWGAPYGERMTYRRYADEKECRVAAKEMNKPGVLTATCRPLKKSSQKYYE